MKLKQVRISADLHQRIKAFAQRTGRKMTPWVETNLYHALGMEYLTERNAKKQTAKIK